MGVVNVTPDSFSDGGRHLRAPAAVGHALRLAEEGAAVIDIGGESTRPGAHPVPAEVETDRVVAVISELAGRVSVPISIDTRKATVAAAALDAGASLVNDISGGLADDAMLATVAARDAGFVAMHMRGDPATMGELTDYTDVVTEVATHLRARCSAALAAGVRPDALLVDPGIGFAKRSDHNLALLRALPALVEGSGVPVMVGASRKRFLGEITGVSEAAERDDATLATTVWCFELGARIVRVHDVASSVRAGRLLSVLSRATPDGIEEDAA